MMTDGKRSFHDRLRLTVARVPVLVVWLLAVAGIWRLSDGAWVSATVSKGYAEARNYSVGPVKSGRIKTLLVDVGGAVKAGEVLATLDTSELDARLARMKVELTQIQSRLKAETDILDSDVTRSEIWVLKTRAGERADRAELQELSARLDRLNALAAQHLVTASEVEATQRTYALRHAEIATYDTAVQKGRAGFTDDSHPAAGSSTLSHKGSVAARLAPYREAIRVQEASMKEVTVLLDEAILKSPVDGFVALVTKRPGEVALACTEVVNIVTTRTGMVNVQVNERIARAISMGTRVKLHRVGASFGDPSLEGRVITVAPQIAEALARIRPSPNIPVWGRIVMVQLDGKGSLLPGEAFDVHFL